MECAVGKQAAFKAKNFVAPEHQQQGQQQAAMEKKNLSEKRISYSQKQTPSPLPPEKKTKENKNQKGTQERLLSFK